MTKRFAAQSLLLLLVTGATVTACSGNSALSTENSIPTHAEPDTAAPAIASPDHAGCDISSEQMRTTMLAAINQSRASARNCGTTAYSATSPLSWNSQLTDAAHAHSTDMAKNNFFSHTGSDGLSVAERAERAGFDWRAIGENIATGQQSVSEVHSNWLQSPGHCSNIMGEQYVDVGASCVQQPGSQQGTYWTVVFGR